MGPRSCQRQILPKDEDMRTQSLYQKIYAQMKTKDTDELIAIWQENDHGLWSDSAFEVIQNLLLERAVVLPKQGEVKVAILPPPKFEIPCDLPYLAWLGICLPWVLFGLLLTWIFLIHPFYCLSHFKSPFWPNFSLQLSGLNDLSPHFDIYGKLYLSLHYIEYGIMSYGMVAGYFVMHKSQKAAAIMKVYLAQLPLFSIYLLFYFNVVPLMLLYWEVSNFVVNFIPDWEMCIETMGLYSSGSSRWGLFIEMLKGSYLPTFATIIWYFFLIRSNWLAKTFSPNPTSSH